VFIEIRHRRFVHVLEVRRAARIRNRVIVAPHQARHSAQRFFGVYAPDRFGQQFVSIAAKNVINLWTAFHDLFGDVVFESRAAEDDRDFGIALFECARERDAREGLLKDNGETDQTEASPIDTVETEIDERGREFFANVAQIGDRTTRVVRYRLQIAAIDPEIFLVVGKVAERGPGPDPLTH